MTAYVVSDHGTIDSAEALNDSVSEIQGGHIQCRSPSEDLHPVTDHEGVLTKQKVEFGESDVAHSCQCYRLDNLEKNILPCTLENGDETICTVYQQELDRERNAAEIAANEAISMILRLQVEKAALQLEARHYKQMLEAKTLCHAETVGELRDVISSQEAEKQMLEGEINEYRQLLLHYTSHVSEESTPENFSMDREISVEPTLLFDGDKFPLSVMVPSCNKETVEFSLVPYPDDETIDYAPMPDYALVPSFKKEIFDFSPIPDRGKWLEPIQGDEDYNCTGMRYIEANETECIAPENTDEAKTKHVVSVSTSNSTNNFKADSTVSKDLLITTSPHKEILNGDEGFSDSKSTNDQECLVENGTDLLGHIMDDCRIQILQKLSNTQKLDRVKMLSSEKCYRIKDLKAAANLDHAITKLKQDIERGYADFVKASLANMSLSETRVAPEEMPMDNLAPPFLKSASSVPVKKTVSSQDLQQTFGQLCGDTNRDNGPQCSTLDSWSDRVAETIKCLTTLEENFMICQRQLQVLESSRKATTDYVKSMNKNMEKPGAVMIIATDLFKGFLSFTSLSCSTLEVLDKLATHIGTLVREVEAAQWATDELSEDVNCGGTSSSSTVQDEASSTEDTDSTMNVLAYLWSVSLQWASNDKCRAETAFCGWDY